MNFLTTGPLQIDPEWMDDGCVAASWRHARDQGCGHDLRASRQWPCWGQLSFRPCL